MKFEPQARLRLFKQKKKEKSWSSKRESRRLFCVAFVRIIKLRASHVSMPSKILCSIVAHKLFINQKTRLVKIEESKNHKFVRCGFSSTSLRLLVPSFASQYCHCRVRVSSTPPQHSFFVCLSELSAAHKKLWCVNTQNAVWKSYKVKAR